MARLDMVRVHAQVMDKRRRELFLTQAQLSRAARVSSALITKIRQGGTVSLEIVHQLAKALDTPVGQLVAEYVEQPSQAGSPVSNVA